MSNKVITPIKPEYSLWGPGFEIKTESVEDIYFSYWELPTNFCPSSNFIVNSAYHLEANLVNHFSTTSICLFMADPVYTYSFHSTEPVRVIDQDGYESLLKKKESSNRPLIILIPPSEGISFYFSYYLDSNTSSKCTITPLKDAGFNQYVDFSTDIPFDMICKNESNTAINIYFSLMFGTAFMILFSFVIIFRKNMFSTERGLEMVPSIKRDLSLYRAKILRNKTSEL